MQFELNAALKKKHDKKIVKVLRVDQVLSYWQRCICLLYLVSPGLCFSWT